jgi:tetratricopeptide (TPR) repeat protein
LKNLHRLILLALGSVAVSGALSAGADDPAEFNQARLEAGDNLFIEKRYLEAIDQFRIAAFGSLAQPSKLEECLIRLALSQNAASRPADADATISRFMDVERRFPSYPPKGLPPELQAEFRSLLLKRVTPSSLQSVPSLANLVETEDQKIAKLPPAERRKALEASAQRDPSSVTWPLALARDAVARSDWKDAEKWADKALSIDQYNQEAAGLRARARVQRGELALARSDLSVLTPSEFDKHPELYADRLVVFVDAGDWTAAEAASPRVPQSQAARADVVKAQQKLAADRQRRATAPPPAQAPAPAPPPASGSSPASQSARPAPAADPAAVAARSKDVLAQSRRMISAGRAGDAQKALSEALTLDPDNRELRLALLEAACLSRAYSEGAAQVTLVTPFVESEAPSMFYAAVVLYETGKTDEARGYLRRAMPRVAGPLVDEYSKKILGTP